MFGRTGPRIPNPLIQKLSFFHKGTKIQTHISDANRYFRKECLTCGAQSNFRCIRSTLCGSINRESWQQLKDRRRPRHRTVFWSAQYDDADILDQLRMSRIGLLCIVFVLLTIRKSLMFRGMADDGIT
ncbi:hypothetical protein AVEN_261710-1 [Araneus ventricosus]|uniref:Uncharacterized protein n=1 Tax=Araneus ventricosus TaxID=182803 RepID=A0A4Y2DWZ7_ARAVE|nr:hypothetical protein AVEN_261710-1 [Araneus ventricosus]